MGERARLHLKVRHHEVDAYGHVNHAHYVHYLETARVEVLESLGLGLPEMRQRGYLIVAAELTIKYHAPAYAAETLEVTTHIREITSGRLVVTAEVTGAFTAETGRPIRIPAAFVDTLSAIVVPADAVEPRAPAS